jgi:hypothetical protein
MESASTRGRGWQPTLAKASSTIWRSRPSHLGAVSEPAVVGHQQAHLALVQGQGLEPAEGVVIEIGDTGVEFKVSQPGFKPVDADEADIDLHGWMLLGEHVVDNRYHRRAHGHGSDTEIAVQVAVHDRQLLDHGVAVGKDTFGPFEDPASFVGETLKTLVAQHDGNFELFLKLLDGARQTWLRDVAPPRGAPEVLFLLEAHQIVELS